jgi:very-short-patch-repair endonuclease
MSDQHATGIEIRPTIDRRISLAMQQNYVPPIKEIEVVNPTAELLKDVVLRVTSEPAFAEPYELRIALVPEGGAYKLTAVDLRLSVGFLWRVTERVEGELKFELVQGESTLATRTEKVSLLARDEWGGFVSLPQILAAFVMPNHPVVATILRKAGDQLGSWTGDPSLSGYQTKDRKLVALTAAAIYTAIQGADITYINPPASFEVEGQRVRLPDRIWSEKMATCLDLATLAASCLEQAGLCPLLVFIKGHAFAGVWLDEECFSEPVVAEPLELRKRVDLGEIAVFDPTCITNRPLVNFDQSVAASVAKLVDIDAFICAIDIRRCRKGQVRPLPETVEEANSEVKEQEGLDSAGEAPRMRDIPLATPALGTTPPADGSQVTAATRLDHWQRKLLDLSLRNRLLNFRETRKSIPILCPDIARMEDAFADGVDFKILLRTKEFTSEDPRDPEAFSRLTKEHPLRAFLREEMKAKRLYSGLAPAELEKNLLEVYRQAHLAIEEGGASPLYLAVGFLAWYETPQSTKRTLAPILLLPLEVHRKSSQEGFKLKLSDDEPRLNVTLVEYLKRDHGVIISGLDPLPEDDSGLDVPKILHVFREAIRDVPRWDVLETVHIGIFSFAKFLMWRDLVVRTADLMKNAVVDHLINRPDQPFDPGCKFPDADRLDDEHSATETYCPLPADASQLAAVYAAAEGKSFVLEGPPGTGKSQTITNLIAHCLAKDKTVLFVSEKMAALNVVHDRLQKVGLGRHCLEVHSNKANKQQVLASLNDVLSCAGSRSPEEWEREAKKLEGLRKDLNAYANALHSRRSTGETVYVATSKLIGLRDVPRVDLSWASVDDVNADALEDLRESVEGLANVSKSVGEIHGNPWDGVKQAVWTPDWQEQVRQAIDRLEAAVDPLISSAGVASRPLGLPAESLTKDQLLVEQELAETLLESPAPPASLVVQPDWEEVKSRIGTWIEHGRRRDALRSELYARYTDRILTLDLDDLTGRLELAAQSSWLTSWWRHRGIRNTFKPVARDGRGPSKDDLSHLLTEARSLRTEEQELQRVGDDARQVLGQFWKDGEADWGSVENVRDWTGRLRAIALRAAEGDPARASELRGKWASLAGENRADLAAEGRLGQALQKYLADLRAFQEAGAFLSGLLELEADRVWGMGDVPDCLGRVRGKIMGWKENMIRLREWCAWRRARAEAIRQNLQPLVSAHERGECHSSHLRRVFDRAFYEWWHRSIVSREPVLAQFFSPEHMRKIEQFRRADDVCMQLSRQIVSARLATKIPTATAIDLPNSEVGTLRREVAKKKRHMPIRKLFQTMPNLLPRLKPCLLMSPMSIAQYLDANFPPFDLVVFDEASQIPVWDSVGAIARGKQVIVVGDPKQLPPTSFFQKMEGADESEPDDGTVEDLESILDDCMGAQVPWLPLNWHYRSRHESLIAFSNYHYYANRLLTFPSPYRDGMGVSWRPVPEGVYDRGRSSTNKGEAEAVVKEIVRRVSSPQLRKYSIGVVTFSIKQQTLIEDLLEETRRTNVDLDAAFSEDAREPIFIKNLENVQGDERDVILFSICYGPDNTGKVAMNFGPMNREGGERRLNVAITRARREVLLFSTLRADQIDLARTNARGVQDLKNFLEYAEKGPSALPATAQYDAEADFESPFEEAVWKALVDKGWEVHRQVGCARYRIDLAVVNPAARGNYLLGIECDGANYHRAKVARDRDKLREGVLRDLGWKLHRIWSTDWWTNPAEEIRKIEVALEAAKRAAVAPEPVAVEAASSTPSIGAEKYSTASTGPPAPPGPKGPPPAKVVTPGAPPAAGQFAEQVRAVPSIGHNLPAYSTYRLASPITPNAQFYDPIWGAKIREAAIGIVNHEAPITLGLATRRVAGFWGLERIHEKAMQRVEGLIVGTGIQMERSDVGLILWPAGAQPKEYKQFRVPGAGEDTVRGVEDLPLVELANAALYVLTHGISAPETEIIRETSRLFGFRRTGRVVEDRIRKGLDLLVETGRASRDGDVISIRRG